ncbi:MAG: hypothetical protein Q9199_002353 [Rusavskia elegans]
MAEEVEDAGRSVPIAIVWSYLLNAAMGFILLTTYIFAIPSVTDALNDPSAYPFIYVFRNALPTSGVNGLTSIILLLVIASNISFNAATSRQTWSFARDNGLPFSTWIGHVNPGKEIPANAVALTCLISALRALINLGSSAAFNAIISLQVVALMFTYCVSISCVLYRRLRHPNNLPAARWSLGRSGVPLNVAGLAYAVYAFFWCFWPNVTPVDAESFNWAVVMFMGVLGLSLDTLNYYEDSSSLPRTDLQLGAGFNLTQTTIYGIRKAMNETFLVTPAVDDTSGRTRFINSYVLARGGAVTYHPTVMQTLYSSPNPDATFAALAKSMANIIRGNGDGSPAATGRAGTYLVLFEGPWPYLILSATLVLAGTAFLLTVIHRTRAAGIAVRCSNVMPSVALGARLGPMFRGDMQLSQMSGITKLQSVQYPKSSAASKPVATEIANGEGGYEILTVDVAPEDQSRLNNSVSDVSDDEMRMGERRYSQVHLVRGPSGGL